MIFKLTLDLALVPAHSNTPEKPIINYLEGKHSLVAHAHA